VLSVSRGVASIAPSTRAASNRSAKVPIGEQPISSPTLSTVSTHFGSRHAPNIFHLPDPVVFFAEPRAHLQLGLRRLGTLFAAIASMCNQCLQGFPPWPPRISVSSLRVVPANRGYEIQRSACRACRQSIWSERRPWSARILGQRLSLQLLRSSQLSRNNRSRIRRKRSRGLVGMLKLERR
jgi:hypothetical protein